MYIYSAWSQESKQDRETLKIQRLKGATRGKMHIDEVTFPFKPITNSERENGGRKAEKLDWAFGSPT